MFIYHENQYINLNYVSTLRLDKENMKITLYTDGSCIELKFLDVIQYTNFVYSLHGKLMASS
jgi:hypothetical protein